MQIDSISLGNGLKIVHSTNNSPVVYLGFAVNAGTRDELKNEHGLAHFVEHMLFKGTKKRKAWHILNRMENVGGELNAYTTKEETFLYTVCLSEDTDRAMELLGDLIFNSQFPEAEIEKERDVVLDEIDSYRDNPSDLIYDEFENLLFAGNELGHNILGESESLETFSSKTCHSFLQRYYYPENMLFFSSGKVPFSKVTRLAQKYFNSDTHFSGKLPKRVVPEINSADRLELAKGVHQTHVIIGGRTYAAQDQRRIGLYLLNNILGGPGMNSRLNISLREKNGLVYNVESGLTTYTDSGLFTIYFGCDHSSKKRCINLVFKELEKLRKNKLTGSQLAAAIKQLKGQLGIAHEQSENIALGMGKSFLHFDKYDNLPIIYGKLDALTPEFLLEIANEVFDEKKLSILIYKE